MNLIEFQKVGFQKAGSGQVRCKIRCKVRCKYGKRKTKMAIKKAKKYVFCEALLETSKSKDFENAQKSLISDM